MVPRTDEMEGRDTDILKPLEQLWVPTVAANITDLVIAQDFMCSDDMDIQRVDSTDVFPKRADIVASKAEIPDPATTSEIDPESEEYLDTF